MINIIGLVIGVVITLSCIGALIALSNTSKKTKAIGLATIAVASATTPALLPLGELQEPNIYIDAVFPQNNTIGVEYIHNLGVHIIYNSNFISRLRFFENSSGSWRVIDSISVNKTGWYNTTNTTFVNTRGKQYFWKVEIYNIENYISEVYNFVYFNEVMRLNNKTYIKFKYENSFNLINISNNNITFYDLNDNKIFGFEFNLSNPESTFSSSGYTTSIYCDNGRNMEFSVNNLGSNLFKGPKGIEWRIIIKSNITKVLEYNIIGNNSNYFTFNNSIFVKFNNSFLEIEQPLAISDDGYNATCSMIIQNNTIRVIISDDFLNNCSYPVEIDPFIHFSKYYIDNNLSQPLWLNTSYLNNNSNIDIIASSSNNELYRYELNLSNNETFNKYLIDNQSKYYQICTADIDNDSDIDIISTSLTDNKVYLFKNNGTGNFSRFSIIDMNGANALCVGDFDNDSDIDIIVSGSSPYVTKIFKNNGTGNFSYNITIDNRKFQRIRSSDIDNDGDLDITCSIGSRLYWYENNGTGNFTAHLISSSYSSCIDNFPVDIDNDSDIDIICIDSWDYRVDWWKNDGSESFTRYKICDSSEPYSIDIGDIDNDSDLDILISEYYTQRGLLLLINNGSQTFTKHYVDTNNRFSFSLMRDINNDSLLDIIAIKKNTNDVIYYKQNPVIKHIWKIRNNGIDYFMWLGSDMYAEDIKKEIIGFDEGNEYIGIWVTNDLRFSNDKVTTNIDGVRYFDIMDYDNDSDLDIIASIYNDDTVLLLKNDGLCNFAGVVINSSFDGVSDSKFADIDSDGDYDILSCSFLDGNISWFENNGTNLFKLHGIDVLSGSINKLDVADFNSDGYIDFVCGDYDYNTLYWYENNGTGNFTAHNIGSSPYVFFVVSTDLDSDGDKDIVTAGNAGDGTCSATVGLDWWENNGTGNFTVHNIENSLYDISSIDIIDLDGDGDLDILLTSSCPSENSLCWFENNGSETFTKHIIDSNFNYAENVDSGDIDNDGDMDIVTCSQSSYDNLYWYENNGSESFTKHKIEENYKGGRDVSLIDINLDERLDIVTSFASSDLILAFKQYGYPPFIWTKDGPWTFYFGNNTGTNFLAKCYDILQINLSDSGVQIINMYGDPNINYSMNRTVKLFNSSNLGINFTGYTGDQTYLHNISTLLNFQNGEVLSLWDNTTYTWRVYLVGFYEPIITVNKYSIIYSKVENSYGSPKIWVIQGPDA